ncbi:MAG TPA: hypothetical protein VEH55_01755 [Gaiellaceae bacterium]|nr:hypothetical protein [Gaiellaceae bacterium]
MEVRAAGWSGEDRSCSRPGSARRGELDVSAAGDLLFGDEAEDATQLLTVFKTLVDLATLAAVIAEAQAELKTYGKRPTLLPHAGRPYRLDIWYPTTLGTRPTPTVMNSSALPRGDQYSVGSPVAPFPVTEQVPVVAPGEQTGLRLRVATQPSKAGAIMFTRRPNQVVLGLEPTLEFGIEADINWTVRRQGR